MKQILKTDVTDTTSTRSINSITNLTKSPEYKRVAGSSLTKSVMQTRQSNVTTKPKENSSHTDINIDFVKQITQKKILRLSCTGGDGVQTTRPLVTQGRDQYFINIIAKKDQRIKELEGQVKQLRELFTAQSKSISSLNQELMELKIKQNIHVKCPITIGLESLYFTEDSQQKILTQELKPKPFNSPKSRLEGLLKQSTNRTKQKM